jgi:peptidoglycan glycosyltransferase
MARIVIEIVKYISIILIALYTFSAFRVAIMKSGKQRDRRNKLMTAFMYLLHAINFLALYITEQNVRVIILYGAQLVMLIGVGALYQVSYRKMSQPVFRNMMMLLIIGFIMITRLSFDQGVRQFSIATVALAGCLIVPMLIERLRTLRKLSWVYGLAGLLTLIIVLFFGHVQNGAKNWIFLGGIKFQPSEFVKLLFIFFVASALSKKHDFKRVVVVTLMAALHVIVLVAEKDLGGALLFFITFMIMLYSATGHMIYMLAGGVFGVGAATLAYQVFAHVRVRVTAFINPFAVIEHEGYQVTQSLFAIGTGGFTGMGLTQGLPSSIPVAESDFIFSAISEELGAVFGICIILICLSSFIMFINISVKFKDPFYKIMALGLSAIYITQVFLNIGGAIKCIPSTGVTLPLVSYGGSSVLSSVLMFSIIQGMYVLHMRREEQVEVAAIDEHLGLETEEKRRFYNKTILSLTYVFSGILFLVIGYYSYFVVAQGKSYINNTYNKRQELLASYITRGKILSADGQILAQTITLEDGYEERVYPYGREFSHVVGRISHGMTGIEQAESFTLLTCHENSLQQLFTTIAGKKINGDNVVTTLNAKLQQVAYDALGDHQGAVVVLEPSTGKILVMVSKPDYNPNTIDSDWEKLNKVSESSLLNRATQGLYAPGSTFKILTTLEYIRENPTDYEDYTYTCKAEDQFHEVTIHCANGSKHGKEDLKESFAHSCNTSFATLGSTLDLDRFNELCTSMLFNSSLPIGIKTSQSSFVLNNESDVNDIAHTVIGLGKTQMTPLHNALIAATVANGGVLMKPYLIDHIETSEGVEVDTYSTEEYLSLMTASEASLLTEYMQEVVENGTGSKLSGMKVSVAGKTGTAEYDTEKEAHAWFVGFAPVEEPEIVISVVVESVGTGSKYAVPIAKKIIQAYYGN